MHLRRLQMPQAECPAKDPYDCITMVCRNASVRVWCAHGALGNMIGQRICHTRWMGAA